jgi:large subunit ribosomal protein L23
MTTLNTIIVKPLITEKALKLGEANAWYVFKVDLKSNKNQIKQALESFYDVKVVDLKTSVTAGKVKRTAKGAKKSTSWKKAYVKLADGQKIEFFKNV